MSTSLIKGSINANCLPFMLENQSGSIHRKFEVGASWESLKISISGYCDQVKETFSPAEALVPIPVPRPW